MALTPNSSPTAYLTVDEFVERKDVRTIGQLATDDGTQATQGQLQANPRVLDALADASGYVESYLVASRRYAAEDLQAANGVSKSFLQRIVADIAMYFMFGGRDAPNPPETVTADYQAALERLKMLGEGTLVLSFVETEEAGVSKNFYMSISQILNLNQTTDRCRRALGQRYYLRRGPF